MDYIIKRAEAKEIEKQKSWLLIHGRRKTGKTFLLRNFCRSDAYFLVKRDLTVFSGKGEVSLEVMGRTVKSLLRQGKTVVIDEFQRLEEGMLEEFTLLHPRGKLLLSGSSMKVVMKVFAPNSPLIGFFAPVRIGFIGPSDILRGLKSLKPSRAVELATYMREPWMIPFYGGNQVTEFVYRMVTQFAPMVPALIGEVFTEEEREMGRTYEAILRLIGAGVWNTKGIASILFSRGVIPNPSVTSIMQYIKNLGQMGLVEGVKLYRSKRNFYRLSSPMMGTYYYLESRYNIGNRSVSLEEVRPTLEKLIRLEIQNFIADYFAEKEGGRKEYYVTPSQEIDFIITKRNQASVVGEVKWKRADAREAAKFRKSVECFPGKKLIVFREGKADGAMTAKDIARP